MLRKLVRYVLYAVAGVLLLALVGGFIAVWPLYLLPTTSVAIERKAPLPPARRPTFEAGVAVRDITPPVGLPKFGYSALAADSDGFRTRLRTRAFCLKPAEGEPAVILQADLGASSLLLHHRVAELVAPRTDVAAHNLMIVATHTHSGPAQYLESDFYNAFGGNRPGFDPRMLEFLATRMADAVIEACTQRREARIGSGQASVWGLTRNRSLAAWLENANIADKRATPERELEAVNPQLTLVRVDLKADDGRWYPAGAFSTFSIHGTGIPAFRGPWHADVWAAFEQEVEAAIRRHYRSPWPVAHAAFEATHGDNNPAWREGLRGDDETARIGNALAGTALQIFTALEGHMRSDVQVNSAMRELDLLALDASRRAPLCERAIVGAAVAGAANGDEVWPIGYLPFLQEDWPRRFFTKGCQAEKQWMLSFLQPLGLPADRLPHRAALQVLRVNELVLVGLPWEITLESGNRIALDVTQALRERGINARTVVASHANGYFGYATTREEYRRQFYEGGHTLYGPGTTDFLARESALLVGELVTRGNFADMPEHWQFNLATRSYWPEGPDPAGTREILETPVFVPGDGLAEPHWRLVYRDAGRAALDLHEPLLAIEARRGADGPWLPLLERGEPVDDRHSLNLQLRWLADEPDGMARYELRWHHPPVAPGLQFRFRVAARGALPDWQSPAFPP